ncbi:dual specificity protein kinase pyk3-like isoform X3 [Drosophila sulfurigaster albostrigata]|nr:dual specificity protein kinase pyk3-like isoform X3 [Drosophila sulfurigaster albostrigata]
MTRNIDWNELIVDNKCIGSGTFGDVYKATWNSNNGPITVVIKQFYRNSTDDKNKKEVDMLSLVNHDNIVKLIGTTKDEKERTAIVMEYAECGSLHSLLHNEENKNIILPHSLRISWMLQCAEAIKYLHELSPTILHRDLKPRNLLLFNNYRTLKICDFGSVKELETIMSYAGTVCYMAPEVASTKSYTEKCDVYSFGITFWEVMSRKKPFYHLGVCEEVAILFSAATKGTRPQLDDIRNIPEYEQIIELIVLCWNGDAEKRPTMQEIISNISNLYPIMDVEEPNLSLKIPVKNEVNRLIDEDMNAIQKNEWTNITLEKLISYGIFGDVYKALWKTEKGPKIIAVKRYRYHYSITSEKLKKIHSLQQKHEHIQQLYCLSFDDNNQPIELMEYADCGTLYSAVHNRTVNIVNNAYEMFSLMWMFHCAKGLKFLHDQNVIHRDITTRNLLLFNNYQTLKISLSETVRTEGTSITKMVGNLIYMAPEIMKDMQYTKKCDIYSFGIILWEVMSRKKPFYHLELSEEVAIPFFAATKGARPHLDDIRNIPEYEQIIELIVLCWNGDAEKRPTMQEIISNISNLYPIMDVEEPNLSLKIPVKNEVNRLIDEDMNAIQKNEWTNITLEKLISYGAFGDVYKALWKTEKGPKIIAVKRYRPHYSIKEQLIKIHSLQLKHEHIQKLYCLSFDHNKRPIELMEYPDCGTLYSAVHDRTVNICNNAYEMFSLMWMLHCAKGLKFLHEQKIVHREITTRNLFLFNNYQTLKISLSEAVMTEGASIMLGNFIYMAPEIMGGMQYTKKCDIYRFGIMLWEVMSRKKPFNDKESLPLLFGIIKGLRPNVNDVVDIHNSDDIKILITKCWDANPRNRPSIKEVLAIMEKYSFY